MKRDIPPYNYNAEMQKAQGVIETYFDEDIETADDAFDVLVDNGVNPEIASQLSQDMYPEQS